jgi:hypothetical protein
MCDGKRIEIVKPLDLFFCLSNIDNSEEPMIKTQDINELLTFLLDQRTRYGLNWNENLLFHIDDESGDTKLMVDVALIDILI